MGILNLYPGYRLLSCTPLFLKYDWFKSKLPATYFCATFILEKFFVREKK